MVNVRIRFYEELNFFLDTSKCKKDIHVSCKKGTTVKALIENAGTYPVPEPEHNPDITLRVYEPLQT